MFNFRKMFLALQLLAAGMLVNESIAKNPNKTPSKASITYLGIEDNNSWDDSSELHFFRVPFKFENGKWAAMPHSPQNEEEIIKTINLYPEKLTFLPNTIATRNREIKYCATGSFKVKLDSARKSTVLSTASNVKLKKSKTITLSESDKQKVSHALKNKLPAYSQYNDQRDLIGKFEWTIADLEFKGISAGGHTFIKVNLKPELEKDPMAGFNDHIEDIQSEPAGDFLTHLYVLVNGEPVFLGKNLEFLECADYANNNSTQFIFRRSAYNFDGYLLFNNSFKDKVHYGWSYH